MPCTRSHNAATVVLDDVPYRHIPACTDSPIPTPTHRGPGHRRCVLGWFRHERVGGGAFAEHGRQHPELGRNASTLTHTLAPPPRTGQRVFLWTAPDENTGPVTFLSPETA